MGTACKEISQLNNLHLYKNQLLYVTVGGALLILFHLIIHKNVFKHIQNWEKKRKMDNSTKEPSISDSPNPAQNASDITSWVLSRTHPMPPGLRWALNGNNRARLPKR